MSLRPLLFRILSVAMIAAGVAVQTFNANNGSSPALATFSALLAVAGLGLLWVLSAQSRLARSNPYR
ncbi:MAG: hypothetical protein QW057_04920 [Candidatus Bathyarchaeia archaeon]